MKYEGINKLLTEQITLSNSLREALAPSYLDNIKSALQAMNIALSVSMPKIDYEGLCLNTTKVFHNHAFETPNFVSYSTALNALTRNIADTTKLISGSLISANMIESMQAVAIPMEQLIGHIDMSVITKQVSAFGKSIDEIAEVVPERIEWNRVNINENELVYEDVIIRKDEAENFLNKNISDELIEKENSLKRKFVVFMLVLSYILTFFDIVDLPDNWLVEKVSGIIMEEQNRTCKYYVSADMAMVYSEKDTASDSLAEISYGHILEAIEEDDFWIKVAVSGENDTILNGWIQKTKIELYTESLIK